MIRLLRRLLARPPRGEMWECSCGTKNEPWRTQCINPSCTNKNPKLVSTRCAF